MNFLLPGLKEQLSSKHPLYILANQVDWSLFNEHFKKHYREDFGRPALPIRLMVALLILKHLRNLSDESMVEQWAENAYFNILAALIFLLLAHPAKQANLSIFGIVSEQKVSN